ncbi:hypothetical protein Tco_1575299 [Tanacetum coccineum]
MCPKVILLKANMNHGVIAVMKPITDSENQETNDDDEETKDEFVHTPPNYVPTDDETNDETNDVDEEQYDSIDRELYGDVNVRLTNAEPDNEDKGDKEMTNAEIVDAENKNVIQESAVNQVKMMLRKHKRLNFTNFTTFTIPVSVIPEHNVINLPKTVTTTSATTISSLLTSLFPHLQQSTPIPTPTTTEATTSTTVFLDSETLTALHQRIIDLEKDLK